jgi:hypothetical protein
MRASDVHVLLSELSLVLPGKLRNGLSLDFDGTSAIACVSYWDLGFPLPDVGNLRFDDNQRQAARSAPPARPFALSHEAERRGFVSLCGGREAV